MIDKTLTERERRVKMKIEADPRPIQSVTMPGEGSLGWWAVGRENITKIELYFENGQMAEVPWLAIYEGNAIAFRINCAAVAYICYDVG